MGTASQQHKLDIRGYNSLGGRKALVKVTSNFGTNAVDAVVELGGRWSSTDSITVLTDIGAGNVNSTYSPSGDVTAEAAATALAAVINAQADHTASAASNVIRITKTTAGTVEVVSAVIS
jgi:hypothetical protein